MEAAAELIERVRLLCGRDHILVDPVALSTYRSDGIRRDGPLPAAVALPGNRAEVIGVLEACHATGMPWTARGAGTSVDGGALPQAGGLVITLARLRRVLSIDLENDELTVEPGTTTARIDRAVAPTHCFPVQPAGTIGGAIAEGALAELLTAIEIVQGDGTLVRANRRLPGYDLAGAFSGSRGTRGIAVALTLRAVPRR